MLKKTYTKLIILCPAYSVTGGPELLHQLASSLNNQGMDASICYYPFGLQSHVTPEYQKYNTNVITLPSDLKSYAVLASEYHTKVLNNLDCGKKFVWWLSVDNYFRYKDSDILRNFFKWVFGSFMFRTPVRNLRDCVHLAQSQYAIDFLNDRGLSGSYLGDYLGIGHKSQRTTDAREDWIAYNPKKSSGFVMALSKAYPQLTFQPIANLTPDGVNDLLHKCKIYLDFGRHPGKDRMPREAALAGCCVITGTRGSAGNSIDIPIPQNFKFPDKYNAHNFTTVNDVICQIFNDFDTHQAQFEKYRKIICREYDKFCFDVVEIFGDTIDG